MPLRIFCDVRFEGKPQHAGKSIVQISYGHYYKKIEARDQIAFSKSGSDDSHTLIATALLKLAGKSFFTVLFFERKFFVQF